MRYEELFEEHSPDMFNHIESNAMTLVDNKVVLYRGTNHSDPYKTTLMKTRFDRIPSDTPLMIHDIVDVWFYKKFGIKARSQSIFTTPKLTFALRYGNAVAILPKGNVTFIYSNNVMDLFHLISRPLHDHLQDLNFDSINTKYDIELKPSMSIKDIYRSFKYSFSDDSNVPTEVYNVFKNVIFEFMDKMDYIASDTLSVDQVKDVEVMVHCNEYYSVGRKSPESYKLEAKYGYLI